ncbi:MAG TPA: radical SAM protein [Elusimicrobiales bacterium]|nr:radical SAM protein [Elusimicrobiales bacterium]
MTTDIVLISPHQPKTAKILRTASGITQPLSISYIASFLIKNGYSVKIIDNDIENLTPIDLETRIRQFNPISVGITVSTSSTNTAIEIAKIVKKINGEIKVIAGGIQPTILPHILLKNNEIDICVMGEGEITSLELLRAIKYNRDISEINGIAYKKNGEIKITEPRKLIDNLDELPIPAYELLPMNRYTLPASRRLTSYPIASVITSRGCPYLCKFCSHNTVFKNKVRFRSPENVLEEMKYLRKKFDVREFVFWDDSILLDKNRAIKIFNMIKKELPDIYFTCSSRVDHINEGIAKLMYEAGCRMILFGAESGSQKILDSINKQITVGQTIKAVEICRNNKIMSFCSFIIGTPEETKETLEETRRFVLKLDPDFAIFTIFTPLPGSYYFNRLINNGEIDIGSANWNDYINLLSSSAPAASVNSDLTKEELVYYQKKLFRDFYLRASYILKRIKKIKNKQMFYQTIRGVKAIIKLEANKFYE